jgi:hypothetical protein
MTTEQCNRHDESMGRSLRAGHIRLARVLTNFVKLTGFCLGLCGPSMAQEMCMISGPTGACQAQANAVALSNKGCAVWANSSYQGSCQNGKLEGVGLLRLPHNDGKNASYYLATFRSGIPEDPVVSYHKETILVNYVRGNNQFSTCVWFDESGTKTDDIRGKNRMCNSATSIFGSEILSDATYQAIRSGRFNITSVVTNVPAAVDDPKTVGRGARAG